MSIRTLLVSLVIPFALAPVAHAGTPEADQARAEIQTALGFVPAFIKALPDAVLPGTWAELAGFQMNTKTALSGRQKELIGLAVAAQVPCRYCIYAHTEFAKLDGATSEDIGVAVAMGALTRHWSTVFNGLALDEAAFRADVDKWVAHAQSPAKTAMPAQSDPLLAEIQSAFGSVPGFVTRVPKEALPGAWRALASVELSDKTSVDGKTKSLIGLAVAAQIPCKYCVIADTAFAKLAGASDREIAEAIEMSAFVRHMSTLLNGLQVDEGGFKKDVDRIARGARKSAGR